MVLTHVLAAAVLVMPDAFPLPEFAAAQPAATTPASRPVPLAALSCQPPCITLVMPNDPLLREVILQLQRGPGGESNPALPTGSPSGRSAG